MSYFSKITNNLTKHTAQTKEIIKTRIESYSWPQRPQNLNFEITSICDSKCIHCPRQEMDRPVRPMDFELFKKMVDGAEKMKIPNLCPNGYGELLTLSNLEDYLDYISSRKFKFRIIINTNGYKLTDDKIDLFVKHKIHLLNIMIDGATKETAESVRVGLETPVIEDNIKRLMAVRKTRKINYPKIRVGMVLIPQNRHEATQFLNKWEGQVDYVGLSGFSNRSGALTSSFGSNDNVYSHPCLLPFQELNVWADGKAVLCCEDWNERYVVGDLNQQSLQDIWHGEALTKARKLHLQKRGSDIEICKECNLWRAPTVGAKLWT